MSKRKVKRAGRPSFKPTPQLRRRVAIAAGGGMAHEEIALALGIARGTLTKHFELELTVGAYERRLEVLEAMHRAAKKGNVAAAKVYAAMTPRAAAPPLEQPGPDEPEGKKAKTNAAARTAQVGTEWETLLQAQPPPNASH